MSESSETFFTHGGYEWFTLQHDMTTFLSEGASLSGKMLLKLMDIVDGRTPKRALTMGLIFSDSEWITVPEGPEHMVLKLAKTICSKLYSKAIAGIRFGTSLPYFNSLPMTQYGLLLFWDRRDRGKHFYTEVNPQAAISLRELISKDWHNRPCIMFFCRDLPDDDGKQ